MSAPPTVDLKAKGQNALTIRDSQSLASDLRSMLSSRPRLRRKDVPAYLASTHGIDIAVATLNKLATIGGGPEMQYSGRIPLYHIDALDAWAEARLSKPVRSTSERVIAA